MGTTYSKKAAVRYILNQGFKFLYMKIKCLDFLTLKDGTVRLSGNAVRCATSLNSSDLMYIAAGVRNHANAVGGN